MVLTSSFAAVGYTPKPSADCTELVSVNPTGIFGPTLVAEARSSLQLIKAMLDGTMTIVPRQRFGVADVRDVADAHIRAMATPAAAGPGRGQSS